MKNNYTQQNNREWGRWVAILGAFFLSAVPASLILFLTNLYTLCEKLQFIGTGDTQLVKDGLTTALTPVELALVFVVPALLCFTVSTFVFQYVRPWTFWPILAGSVIALFLNPLSFALGGSLLLTLYFKRDQYFGSTLDKVEHLSPTEF